MGLPHKTRRLHNLRQPHEICLRHILRLPYNLRLPHITILIHRMMKSCQIREEQDLLEILDLVLFGVKTIVLILIEPSLATVVLLDSCFV